MEPAVSGLEETATALLSETCTYILQDLGRSALPGKPVNFVLAEQGVDLVQVRRGHTNLSVRGENLHNSSRLGAHGTLPCPQGVRARGHLRTRLGDRLLRLGTGHRRDRCKRCFLVATALRHGVASSGDITVRLAVVARDDGNSQVVCSD